MQFLHQGGGTSKSNKAKFWKTLARLCYQKNFEERQAKYCTVNNINNMYYRPIIAYLTLSAKIDLSLCMNLYNWRWGKN